MTRSAVVLCLLVAACSSAPRTRLQRVRPVHDGRIVGGEPVEISQFPWQVSLEQLERHKCGGSIIGSTWVLTAAHCLSGSSASILSVRASTSPRESGGSVFDVANIIEHEEHNIRTNDYDFGLVEITGLLSYDSNVQVVNLGTSELASGTAVTVTGWGSQYFGGPLVGELQAVTTTIVDRAACDAALLDDITERMICAGERQGGKDACRGDSGGPLVAGNTQYGIVSMGAGCADPKYPGVYSNVPYARSWITEKTGV